MLEGSNMRVIAKYAVLPSVSAFSVAVMSSNPLIGVQTLPGRRYQSHTQDIGRIEHYDRSKFWQQIADKKPGKSYPI